jgi:hypothetical protein
MRTSGARPNWEATINGPTRCGRTGKNWKKVCNLRLPVCPLLDMPWLAPYDLGYGRARSRGLQQNFCNQPSGLARSDRHDLSARAVELSEPVVGYMHAELRHGAASRTKGARICIRRRRGEPIPMGFCGAGLTRRRPQTRLRVDEDLAGSMPATTAQPRLLGPASQRSALIKP